MLNNRSTEPCGVPAVVGCRKHWEPRVPGKNRISGENHETWKTGKDLTSSGGNRELNQVCLER